MVASSTDDDDSSSRRGVCIFFSDTEGDATLIASPSGDLPEGFEEEVTGSEVESGHTPPPGIGYSPGDSLVGSSAVGDGNGSPPPGFAYSPGDSCVESENDDNALLQTKVTVTVPVLVDDICEEYGVFICMQYPRDCARTCTSKKGCVAHQVRVHGRVAVTRLFVDGSLCPVYGQNLGTRTRAIHHASLAAVCCRRAIEAGAVPKLTLEQSEAAEWNPEEMAAKGGVRQTGYRGRCGPEAHPRAV